jgi:hypothetical protein
MKSASAHEEIRWGTPALGSISIAGTTVFEDGPRHAADLADFKAWLRERHPGARVTVRCRWRPEEYGRVKITLTPATPLAPKSGVGPEDAQKRLLWIEQGLIERVWREGVGWVDY